MGVAPFDAAGPAAVRRLALELRQGSPALSAQWLRVSPAYRSPRLRDGDDLAAERALKRDDALLVEATLLPVVHPAVIGGDGSRLPALVEYRLVAGRVVDWPER